MLAAPQPKLPGSHRSDHPASKSDARGQALDIGLRSPLPQGKKKTWRPATARGLRPSNRHSLAGERAPSLPESDALFYPQVWLSPRSKRGPAHQHSHLSGAPGPPRPRGQVQARTPGPRSPLRVVAETSERVGTCSRRAFPGRIAGVIKLPHQHDPEPRACHPAGLSAIGGS